MAKGGFSRNIIILFIIICVLVYRHMYISSHEGFQAAAKNIELVVARYKENIDWLKKYDDGTFNKITIYNKSQNQVSYTSEYADVQIKQLPNVGVCDHTYLYHIVNEYDRLADITVFIPGSGTLEHKKNLIDFTVNNVKKTNNSVVPVYTFDTTLGEAMYNFMLDKYNVESPENREGNIQHVPSLTRPFGAWYTKYFGDYPVKKATFTGIFAASREHIHAREKESYGHFLEQVSTNAFHEAAHYIERAWTAILKGVPEECMYDSPVHQQRIGVTNGGYNYLRRK